MSCHEQRGEQALARLRGREVIRLHGGTEAVLELPDPGSEGPQLRERRDPNGNAVGGGARDTARGRYAEPHGEVDSDAERPDQVDHVERQVIQYPGENGEFAGTEVVPPTLEEWVGGVALGVQDRPDPLVTSGPLRSEAIQDGPAGMVSPTGGALTGREGAFTHTAHGRSGARSSGPSGPGLVQKDTVDQRVVHSGGLPDPASLSAT